MSDTVMYSLGFALMGMMFVGLSIPLIRGKIPPNHCYGFRTPKTLSNEKIWYEANRVSGMDLFIAGSLITLTSVSMFVFARSLEPKTVVLTLFSVMIFTLVGALVHGFVVLSKM